MFAAVTALTVLQERDRMYRAARDDARRNVARNIAAISTGLWNYDTAALNATLLALTQSGSIVRAEVRDLNRQVAEIAREDKSSKRESVWEVPVMGPDNSKQIGTLKIAESYSEVRDLLAGSLATVLVAELTKIVGLAALLFVIIYSLITRHLNGLARDVSNLVPGKPLAQIALRRTKVRHDELDTLVDSINRFRNERAEVESALLRDIAERKRVEAALTKTEGDLSEALQIARLAYWQYDSAPGQFIFNDQYYSLHRTSAAHMGGYRIKANDVFQKLIQPEDALAFAAYIWEALEAEQTVRPGQFDVRILCADGDTRSMLVSCRVEPGGAGEAVRLMGTMQDITERKRARDALRAAQSELARVTRLTTVGQMAASIAHEINQPLGAIVANGNAGLRFLRSKTPDLAEAQEALVHVVREGHRASEVIAGIRAMFKKGSQESTPLDVNQVIREVLALVQGELQNQSVSLQTELTEELPPVSAVRVQLQQVILNLLTNAIEAMASKDFYARLLRVTSQRREHHDVLITVEDSGPGIDPKNADHIFDLFFTTKSHGMGMGLSICRSIVEAHGGRLSVLPGIDGGSAFQISLPNAESVRAR
ncbi:PAS domain S-box-containing protein [Rhizobiales bacterium GAS191]|nr:PAS domain S-box-containing protein [Rhizobiales bacterium GAS191]